MRNERRGVEIVRPAKAGGTTSGTSFARFRVKNWSDYPDSIVCKQWDGATEGETEIHVAKPPAIRRTPFDNQTITIDGVDYRYDYTSNLERQSIRTSDDNTETQIVTPDYYLNQEIVAKRGIAGGTGVEVTGVGALVWQEAADARCFAEKVG